MSCEKHYFRFVLRGGLGSLALTVLLFFPAILIDKEFPFVNRLTMQTASKAETTGNRITRQIPPSEPDLKFAGSGNLYAPQTPPNNTNSNDRKMPNLIGKPFQEAKKLLTVKYDHAATVVYQASDSPKDEVLSHDPPPFTSWDEGKQVILYVSNGAGGNTQSNADLAVKINLKGKKNYKVGDLIKFEITVKNLSPVTAYNVKITLSPQNLNLGGACADQPCLFDALQSNESKTLTSEAVIAARGEFNNKVTVSSSNDSKTENNVAIRGGRASTGNTNSPTPQTPLPSPTVITKPPAGTNGTGWELYALGFGGVGLLLAGTGLTVRKIRRRRLSRRFNELIKIKAVVEPPTYSSIPNLPLSAPTVGFETYLELGQPALVHVPINRVEENDE